MPHPRNRDYRPITPDWLADEIQLAGDLDGARRVWRRFTNRLAQTGEATSLDSSWGDALAVLGERGAIGLARTADRARKAELSAPRKRAPKTFKRITDEQVAGAVVQAGSVEGIRRVWQRYRRNLAEAHQGDIAERWPRVLEVLQRLGRPDLIPLAQEARRREVEAREQAHARRLELARQARRWNAPPPRPTATSGPVRESPALKVTKRYVLRVDQELLDDLDAHAVASGESKTELIRRYLARGVGFWWGDQASEWSTEFQESLDGLARELGLSRNALIVRLIREGLARDGVAAHT